jgi:DNA-binding response OmpR family regulator
MDPADQAPILVVDDDEASRTVLRLACETAGIPVVEARTGTAALRLAATGTYAAILLDLGLPDVSGLEVCRRVRAADVVTPILIVSAYTAPGQVELCRAAGADDHIGKPYSLSRLLSRLHAYIDPGAPSRLLAGTPPGRTAHLPSGR